MTAQGYRNELLLALRLRDVPGPRIAEALAEVDSHLSESGEDPLEAFGPPRAYAELVASALAGPGPFWRTSLGWTAAGYAAAGGRPVAPGHGLRNWLAAVARVHRLDAVRAVFRHPGGRRGWHPSGTA